MSTDLVKMIIFASHAVVQVVDNTFRKVLPASQLAQVVERSEELELLQ